MYLLFVCICISLCGARHGSYMDMRNSLVEAEEQIKFSDQVTLTANELEAKAILDKLSQKEAAVMGDNFPPSMNFFQAYPWIKNSSVLFPVIQAMPKGVVHHLHLESSATYDYIIANLTYSPYCFIFQGNESAYGPVGTMYMFENPPSNEWVNVHVQRMASNDVAKFDKELLAALTLGHMEFSNYVDLWKMFDGIFSRVDGLIYYKEGFEGYLQHMVSQMLADGIQNIEVKISPDVELYDLQHNIYNFDYIAGYIYDVINKTRLYEPAFTMKVILSDERSHDSTTILPLLKLSLRHRNMYPDLVVGFDLDGPEDEGHELLYFMEDFQVIANISKDYEYKLEYYMHAGETLMYNNTNLYDAILLDCYRIGHAFQLSKHPLLLDMVKEKRIGLEICPISNQILQFSIDLRDHPALDYFQRGLLITISSDDPAIFGYGGTSFDWYEATLAWGLNIRDLKQLALNSYIKGSFFSQMERFIARGAWQAKWDKWIDWVLETYRCSHCSIN